MRRALLWTSMAAALVATDAILLETTSPAQMLILGYFLAPIFPLEILVYANYVNLRDSKTLDVAFVNYVYIGVHSALILLFCTKFLPSSYRRIAHDVSRAVRLTSLTPRFVGVLLTTASELAIIPAALVLLNVTAWLLALGEKFDAKNVRADTLVVLCHGNGFNECQWVFGRILLNARFPNVDLTTVNLFKGPALRHAHDRTRTVEDCARLAVEQIDCEGYSKIVLMGHSLGGLVASKIATKKLLHNVSDVVCWSAPLNGSDLLRFGQNLGIVSKKNHGIDREFEVESVETKKLREDVFDDTKTTYFGVTGWCDPLVRPHSALINGFHANSVSLAYLGHYNIKLDGHAWHTVLDHLEARLR